MGFPVGCTELFLPKLLIRILTLLGLIRKLISSIFHFVSLGDVLEPEFSTNSTRTETFPQFQSVSTVLIRELLPVVKFSELVDLPESCVVCLYEFDVGDEIRRLTNCRHIFHRSCLDRWMDHDQKTYPLCRPRLYPTVDGGWTISRGKQGRGGEVGGTKDGGENDDGEVGEVGNLSPVGHMEMKKKRRRAIR